MCRPAAFPRSIQHWKRRTPRYLEKAVLEERIPILVQLVNEPGCDCLRGNPRLHALLRKMNLPALPARPFGSTRFSKSSAREVWVPA